ncbi:hypothetical protein MMC18_004898 [Xylographa bjoerkii]|nr:hypothetical protein [Xylographa bjoerkii]
MVCRPYSTSLDAGWTPIPALKATLQPAVTILFVMNQGVDYPAEQNDLIFPAHTNVTGAISPRWQNTDERATVLGCADELSYYLNGICWNASEADLHIPDDDELKLAYALLRVSARESNMYQAMQYRGGSGFDAADKFGHYKSLNLAQEQWKIETKLFFEASLVRIRIYARDIARGNPTANAMAAVVGKLNGSQTGACGMYKFKSDGWTNINFNGLLLTF